MRRGVGLRIMLAGLGVVLGMGVTGWAPGIAQELEWDPIARPNGVQPAPPVKADSPVKADKPFQLSVSESRFLPPDMYGQWSVRATLIRTNMPVEDISEVVYDIWLLENVGDTVSISNPATGAQASISVDEVNGNTAKFHRKVVSPGRVFIEQPTVTVDGDVMLGRTVHRYIRIKNSGKTLTWFAEFDIRAERLHDGRVKMGKDVGELQFEIEDIQDGPPVKKLPAETVDSTMYAR
jgi:hypothetical protein